MNVVLDAMQLKMHNTSSDEAIIPYVIAIDATGTSASSFTYTLTQDVRVIDAWAVAAAANGGATVQIQDNDGNAITDAMDIASNKALARATEIDDANWEEDSGNELKAVQNANGDSCYVYIVVVPIKS